MQTGRNVPLAPGKAGRLVPEAGAARLLANHKLRRPVEPPMAVMYLQQRVRTKLEKVAAILKSEITHDALEFIQIIQADARRTLSASARCFVFRRRFHSDFHTQGIRSLSAVPPIDSIRLVTAKVLAGLDGGS